MFMMKCSIIQLQCICAYVQHQMNGGNYYIFFHTAHFHTFLCYIFMSYICMIYMVLLTVILKTAQYSTLYNSSNVAEAFNYARILLWYMSFQTFRNIHNLYIFYILYICIHLLLHNACEMIQQSLSFGPKTWHLSPTLYWENMGLGNLIHILNV